MFERLKSLLHRKKSLPELAKENPETVRISEHVVIKTDIPEVAELARKHRLNEESITRELEKHERIFSIREKNLERQRNVLGSGLKSRNFRPRPAHEKKLFKLDKKAEDD